MGLQFDIVKKVKASELKVGDVFFISLKSSPTISGKAGRSLCVVAGKEEIGEVPILVFDDSGCFLYESGLELDGDVGLTNLKPSLIKE